MSVHAPTGIAWSVAEHGGGPPLLLLHGFTGAGASWEPLLGAFGARFRVIAPDLPGHGRTPPTPTLDAMTVEATADSLAGLLERLGATPARVLGYSMGARIALRLAVAHSVVVARLVLESPSAGIADAADRSTRHAADETLARSLEEDGIEPFVTTWERNPIFERHAAADPALVARQRAIRLASDPAGLAASLRAAGQGSMAPLHDRLGEITAPTLVIAGALDTVGRPRAAFVAEGIPGARLALVDDAGHTPHLEATSAFARLALDFLLEDPPA